MVFIFFGTKYFLFPLSIDFYSLMQLSAHRWVREGGSASDIPIDISVLNNMRQFVKYGRLKQFALRVTKMLCKISLRRKGYYIMSLSNTYSLQALASTLDEEELADLKDQFAAIDVDKNGSISLEEMREVSISFSFHIHSDEYFNYIMIMSVVCMQALAQDLPWKMKDSRVLEILQAVTLIFTFVVSLFSPCILAIQIWFSGGFVK